MKTQMSRWSHRPARRYHGVYLQQGRMVTDADWNEQVEHAKAALRGTADDAVGAGVPREGGAIERTGDTTAQPRWGAVHVDGIRAAVVPDDGDPDSPFDLGHQADLLAARGQQLQAGMALYVDVWERTVVSLQDDLLVDPALGGADTASRQQVLVQLKLSPAPGGEPDAGDPVVNPPIGNGRFGAVVRQAGADPDPCDPCADEVEIEVTVPNAMFRLEVHDVDRPVDPQRLHLKWSMENGAEAHPLDPAPPAWFDTSTHLLEPFNVRTEQNMGVFLQPPGGDIGAPALADNLVALQAPPQGEEWTGARRWDGQCVLTRAGNTWTVQSGTDRGLDLVAGADQIAVAGDEVSLPLRSLAVTLTLPTDGTLRALRGDYWLARVRALPPVQGNVDRRVQVVSTRPLGIEHHYLVLGIWDGQQLDLVTDGARRARSFPPLTDLRADDVGYAPCEDSPFDGSETTVKKALDALCDLDAADIGLDSDCGLLAESDTVADALDVLCEEVQSKVQDCWPRLALFGRGVVCGVVPTLTPVRDFKPGLLDAIGDALSVVPLERAPLADAVSGRATERAELIVELVEGVRDDRFDEVRAEVTTLTGREHLAITEEVFTLIDEFAGIRKVPGTTVKFSTIGGTVIDGHGCIHQVPDLTLTHRIRSFTRKFDVGIRAPGLLTEFRRLAREQPTVAGRPLSEATWTHDVGGRVETLIGTVIEAEPTNSAEARAALAELDWNSVRLRDHIGDVFAEAGEQELRPVKVTGWLFMVFPAGQPAALQFRTDPPKEWHTAPSLLAAAMAANQKVNSRSRLKVASTVATVLASALAEAEEGGLRALSNAEALLLAEEATDDRGRIDLGRASSLVRERYHVDVDAATVRDVVVTELTAPGTAVTRPVAGQPAAAEPVAAEAGATITETGRPDLVLDPEILVMPVLDFDEFRPELAPGVLPGAVSPVDRAWAAYSGVSCPPENDGAVCLGKVAAFGDTVVIVPDDREQVLATPANLNAVYHLKKSEMFDDVMDEISGG